MTATTNRECDLFDYLVSLLPKRNSWGVGETFDFHDNNLVYCGIGLASHKSLSFGLPFSIIEMVSIVSGFCQVWNKWHGIVLIADQLLIINGLIEKGHRLFV